MKRKLLIAIALITSTVGALSAKHTDSLACNLPVYTCNGTFEGSYYVGNYNCGASTTQCTYYTINGYKVNIPIGSQLKCCH